MLSMVGSITPIKAHADNSSSVLACGHREGSAVRYTYTFNNADSRAVAVLIIGFDDSTVTTDIGKAILQLNEAPVGTDFDDWAMPASSFSIPPGWRGIGYLREDYHGFAVEIDDVDENLRVRGSPIPAGSSVRFSVLVAKADPLYLTGRMLVGPLQGMRYTLPITMDDHAPPVISVSVRPIKPTSPTPQIIPVVADITVSDDCDPSPAVILKSVTDNRLVSGAAVSASPRSNVPGEVIGHDVRRFSLPDTAESYLPGDASLPERIYTITYLATDLSGKTASSAANFTVPLRTGK